MKSVNINNKIIYEAIISTGYIDYQVDIYDMLGNTIGVYNGRAYKKPQEVSATIYLNDILYSYKPLQELADYNNNNTPEIYFSNNIKCTLWEMSNNLFIEDYIVNFDLINYKGFVQYPEKGQIILIGEDKISYGNSITNTYINTIACSTYSGEEVMMRLGYYNSDNSLISYYITNIYPQENSAEYSRFVTNESRFQDAARVVIEYLDPNSNNFTVLKDLRKLCADYTLRYKQPNGAVIDIPVKGRFTASNRYKKTKIKNIYEDDVITNITSRYSYEINLGMINNFDNLEGIFSSDELYLIDNTTNIHKPVRLTTNNITFKTWKNTKSFNDFSINVEDIRDIIHK